MSVNNKTNCDDLNKQNQKALSNRKRSFKTLDASGSGTAAAAELESKKIKLTQSNETVDQDSSSLESKVYAFKQIVTSEPSPTRSGEMRYLIHWKGETIVDATWQHADKFDDPVHIKNYEKLSLRAKQRRIAKYNNAVQEFKKKAAEMNFVDKQVQCEIIVDDSRNASNSVEILSSYCDPNAKHWPKLTKAIDDLKIIWDNKNISTFMAILPQFALMVNKHQNGCCKVQVNDMTHALKDVYHELVKHFSTPINIISESSSPEPSKEANGKIKDQEDDGSEELKGEIICSSSERSQDSSPGTTSQEEITPDSNNPEYDTDYEPDDEDDVASEVDSEQEYQNHSPTASQCLLNSNSAPMVSLLTPSDTECPPVAAQNIICDVDSPVLTLD